MIAIFGIFNLFFGGGGGNWRLFKNNVMILSSSYTYSSNLIKVAQFFCQKKIKIGFCSKLMSVPFARPRSWAAAPRAWPRTWRTRRSSSPSSAGTTWWPRDASPPASWPAREPASSFLAPGNGGHRANEGSNPATNINIFGKYKLVWKNVVFSQYTSSLHKNWFSRKTLFFSENRPKSA
jgi:hypothetical protein